jgi:hypothetical protein
LPPKILTFAPESLCISLCRIIGIGEYVGLELEVKLILKELLKGRMCGCGCVCVCVFVCVCVCGLYRTGSEQGAVQSTSEHGNIYSSYLKRRSFLFNGENVGFEEGLSVVVFFLLIVMINFSQL